MAEEEEDDHDHDHDNHDDDQEYEGAQFLKPVVLRGLRKE